MIGFIKSALQLIVGLGAFALAIGDLFLGFGLTRKWINFLGTLTDTQRIWVFVGGFVLLSFMGFSGSKDDRDYHAEWGRRQDDERRERERESQRREELAERHNRGQG